MVVARRCRRLLRLGAAIGRVHASAVAWRRTEPTLPPLRIQSSSMSTDACIVVRRCSLFRTLRLVSPHPELLAKHFSVQSLSNQASCNKVGPDRRGVVDLQPTRRGETEDRKSRRTTRLTPARIDCRASTYSAIAGAPLGITEVSRATSRRRRSAFASWSIWSARYCNALRLSGSSSW